MACGDGAALVAWMGPRGGRKLVAETPSAAHALAVALAEPLVPLLVAPARGWDLDAPERAHVGGELGAWPFPRFVAAPVGRYPGRARVEPPPLRQQGVALPRGVSLARALAQVRPSPWAQVVGVGKGRAA